MPIFVTYPETAFVGKGSNPIRPRMLVNTVRASGSISTPVVTFRVENPGTGNIPEVDDSTGRTWQFEFIGSGSLPAPELTALNAIVAAHDGTEVADRTTFTMPSGSTALLGTVAVGQAIVRTASGVFSGQSIAASTVQYVEIASASQTNSSASYSDITGLSLPVVSGKSYRFEGVVHFSMSLTSGSPGVAINGPIASVNGAYTIPKTATATLARSFSGVDSETDSTSVTITANTILPFQIRGRFTASSDGTVALRCKRYGSGTVSIRDYSWLRLEEIS